MVEIDLNKTDINQCAQDDTMFSKSHKCFTETTQVKIYMFHMVRFNIFSRIEVQFFPFLFWETEAQSFFYKATYFLSIYIYFLNSSNEDKWTTYLLLTKQIFCAC